MSHTKMNMKPGDVVLYLDPAWPAPSHRSNVAAMLLERREDEAVILMLRVEDGGLGLVPESALSASWTKLYLSAGDIGPADTMIRRRFRSLCRKYGTPDVRPLKDGALAARTGRTLRVAGQVPRGACYAKPSRREGESAREYDARIRRLADAQPYLGADLGRKPSCGGAAR